MKLGLVYPQTEFGSDLGLIREFAVTAEELGYQQLILYEHVLGADPQVHELSGPYTWQTEFHEPFVLFGYLSAVTSSMELVTGILVLPQRPTALVAKQAATLDFVSNGRLVLGGRCRLESGGIRRPGPGLPSPWGAYRGTDSAVAAFVVRAAAGLRRHFRPDHGRRHRAPPRPAHTHLDGWLGRRRTGTHGTPGRRLAGRGRQPQTLARPEPDPARPATSERRLGIVHDAARSAGRDPAAIEVSMLVSMIGFDEPERFDAGAWAARGRAWGKAGATSVALATLDLGFSPAEHLDAIVRFAQAWKQG